MTINQTKAIKRSPEIQLLLTALTRCRFADSISERSKIANDAVEALAATTHITPGAAVEVDPLAWLIHSGDIRKPVLTVYSSTEAAGYHPQWVVPLGPIAAQVSPAIAPEASELPPIKTWQERTTGQELNGSTTFNAMKAEIADLRAAIANLTKKG